MRPHVTASYGVAEFVGEVIREHLASHHRVDPNIERPFVVTSTPVLENRLGKLQIIQVTILVTAEKE